MTSSWNAVQGCRYLNELNQESIDGGCSTFDSRYQIDNFLGEPLVDPNRQTNETFKTCEKQIPTELQIRIDEKPLINMTIQRRMTSSACDGLNKVTDGVAASTAHAQCHSTVEKECQTSKSSVRRWKTKQEQMRRVRLGLCVLGWVLCCPCWTVGFSLRDSTPYGEASSSHPRCEDNRSRCTQRDQKHHDGVTSSSPCRNQRLRRSDSIGSLRDPCWPFDEIFS